jgi:hypothetical protein
MNDNLAPRTDPEGPPDEHWLADPEHPTLATAVADRINDPVLPDRLAWNTFRTLAQWNTDRWVPPLLEVALGPSNPLSGLEWGEASVELWRSWLHLSDAVDVVIDGPAGLLLVEATLRADLTADHLVEGAELALGLPDRGARQAGYVLVTPGIDDAEVERLEDRLTAELLDLPEGEGHGLRPEAIEGLTGWMTWADLGALALDLAEEADPVRAEMVHLLITELQRSFPELEV